MKILFDFLPTLLFFAAYKGFPSLPAEAVTTLEMLPLVSLDQDNPNSAVLFATLVGITVSLTQWAIQRLLKRPIDSMQWISLGLILVFGGATLLFQDAAFIQWKPSIFNWLLAAAFLLSPWLHHQPLAQVLMGSTLNLPSDIWFRVNLLWGGFFLLLGIINLWVAYSFSLDTWVDFKLYGLTGLTIVFLFAQSLYLAKHMSQDDVSEDQS